MMERQRQRRLSSTPPAFLEAPREHAFTPQPKLELGRRDDPLERQADAVAAQVAELVAPAAEQHGETPTEADAAGLEGDAGTLEQASARRVQRKPSTPNGALATGRELEPVVRAGVHGGGRPLDPRTRADMEARLGHRFDAVRVHSDERASDSAAALAARAYTVGGNIVVRAGQYAPETTAGRQLLAHELTHVVQQRAAPRAESLIQRAPPDGAPAAPAAPPAAAPPATTPAPAPAPAPPVATGPERELVETALKSKDPGDVKAITNVFAASEDERLELIRILNDQGWVGIRDEWKLEELWKSFGDRLTTVAGAHLPLWEKSVAGGADVDKLPQAEKIKIDFMNDVRLLALDYLKKNREYIRLEQENIGIGSKAPTGEQNNQLKNVQDAAQHIENARAKQRELRKIQVGYLMSDMDADGTVKLPAGEMPVTFPTTFYPDRPTIRNLDDSSTNAQRDWNKVNAIWEPIEHGIRATVNVYPSLYAALQQSESHFSRPEDVTGADDKVGGIANAASPEAARDKINEVLKATLDAIAHAESKIPGNDPDYRDFVPLHGQLLSGTAPSLASSRVWRNDFNKWVVMHDLEGYKVREFWERLGLKTAAMGIIAITEVGTAGAATFLWAAVGLTATGVSFASNLDNYMQLQNASKTNVNDDTTIVDKATVTGALGKAVEDAANFLTILANVGLKLIPEAKEPAGPTKGPTPTSSAAGAKWTEADMHKNLSGAEDGRWAVETQKKYGVTIEARDDAPTAHYEAKGNKIVMPTSYDSKQASVAFIHEMGHAEYANKKWSATGQPFRLDRDQYVDLLCHEESVVHGRTIRGKFELNRADANYGAEPGEQLYGKAAGAAYKSEKARNPNISDEAARDTAHTAGVNALYRGFKDGTIRTTGDDGRSITYPEFYGEQWKGQQPFKPEKKW
jgi:hypothetical protein